MSQEAEHLLVQDEDERSEELSDDDDLLARGSHQSHGFTVALSDVVGGFGWTQIRMFIILLIANIYGGYRSLFIIFVTQQPDFRCATRNLTLSFFPEVEEFEWESSLSNSVWTNKCLKGCTEYEYASSPSSMVSQFDMACGSKSYLPKLLNSAFWLGFGLIFVVGALGDLYGRRLVSIIFGIFYCIFSIISCFTMNVYILLGLQILIGVTHATFIIVAYLIMVESVSAEYVGGVGLAIQVIFALGEMTAALMGYIFVDSWRSQMIAVTVPLPFLVLAAIIFLPESPRWLYSTGNIQDAETVMSIFANSNNARGMFACCGFGENQQRTVHVRLNHSEVTDNSLPTMSLLDLFKTLKLLTFTISCILTWFTISLVYFGLTFNVGHLAGSVYFNSFLMALVELPAFLTYILIDRFGRKTVSQILLFFCMCACLALPFLNKVNTTFGIILALIGKLAATSIFDLLYVYQPELLPTPVRSFAFSMCTSMARFGSILAPFIGKMGELVYFAPYLVFASMSGICLFLNQLFLMETRGRQLPQTVEDMFSSKESKKI